ncbi:MAG: S41 family peptidase [Bacteroidota bacterium]
MTNQTRPFFPLLIWMLGSCFLCFSQGFEGYYQFPDIQGETIVFAAEGDIWSVSTSGGLARRLTTHPGEEQHPIISPDGQTLAFTARYEGPAELYTMPLNGGIPTRWTYESESSIATCWTPGGSLVYATYHYATLPDYQLVSIDLASRQKTRVPLAGASEASYDASGKTLYFVRPGFHGNVTKRYEGGTARKIWKFTEGTEEAIPLTQEYKGESHHPMWWKDRVYFISDRDGIMNVWSMNESGGDLQKHSQQTSFDVRDADVSDGRIVYHAGADLWLLDIESGKEERLEIRLASDLDQLREKWVKNPQQYITSVQLHPTGEQLVITARGRVFVAPVKDGRLVQLSRKEGVRYRDAVFSADGEDILVLSDESGEFEFVKIAASGIGEHQELTDDGKILRFRGVPSPDEKWLAYYDLNRDLWLLNLENGKQETISTNREGIFSLRWSPDSKWLCFGQAAMNSFGQLHLYQVDTQRLIPLTSDRANSSDPCWSPDGKWLYYLSDRNFQSLVGSPWGSRQPEPYFDRKMKLYEVALQQGNRSPFQPDDELHEKEEEPEEKDKQSDEKADKKAEKEVVAVNIDVEGLQERIREVPLKPGNYRSLQVNKKAIYWVESGTGLGAKSQLMKLKIDNKDPKPKMFAEGMRGIDLSADGKKIFFRKGSDLYVVDADKQELKDLSSFKVELKGWTFSLNPKEDWRQIYTDAWRMERDYFYDPNMHGVDWDGMYEKYLPLVDRVTTRAELSDVIGRFVGELSALHTSVRGGDLRNGPERVGVANLGAVCMRDESMGGFRIDHIYRTDPDYPNERSPLADPNLNISVGDVITQVNGVPALSAIDIGALIRNQADKQVRISVKSATDKREKEVVVTPISNGFNLRYRDWEYSRRLEVESKSENKIGYVHLRAMGSRDLAQWYREFYPVFNRQGLIVDVRHNNGGNIESFILEKLMRKDWMYWANRAGQNTWNMQYAFRGHIVVLCDENTASDGEAFADGFRRLGLGKTIGARTWGGEIWLSGVNRLSDGGIARAPMFGVYGPEGEWLIEGHGFVPDIEVLNLPHTTFNGNDAQLEAAIKYLLEEINKDPRPVPKAPPFPDKSFRK